MTVGARGRLLTGPRGPAGGRRALWKAVAALAALVALGVGVGWLAIARAETAAPKFVQEASAHSGSATSLAVTPAANVTTGDSLVVEVGVWSATAATAASVTDSAGNSYVELLHFKAADQTEMSVWTTAVTAGGGTKPTITVKPSSKADVGVVVLEYSGVATLRARRSSTARRSTRARPKRPGQSPRTHRGNDQPE